MDVVVDVKRGLRRSAGALVFTPLLLLAGPALAINNGTPTNSFLAVSQGVQVTPDWVFTAQHVTLSPGQTYSDGYGTRVVAARYDAPGSGEFPANDFSLLRLVPMATAAPYLPVRGDAIPAGTLTPFDVTIASSANSSLPRAYGFTQISESQYTIDPDDDGPLGPVVVNWLVSWDRSVYVQGGDSGGGLFLGHVLDSSILLGLSSAQYQDENDVPTGSAFVQPAAYRSWIDQTMAADLADAQVINWVSAGPVPEPATWLLWAAGLACVAPLRTAALRRRGASNCN